MLKSSDPAEFECDGVNGGPCRPMNCWGNCCAPWKYAACWVKSIVGEVVPDAAGEL